MKIFPCHWIADHGTPSARCSCGSPRCTSNAGKHPLTANGFKQASDDPKQIEAWRGQFPEANWGIATGGGFFVVDLDIKPGKNGLASFKALGTVPKTRTVRTGSGGLHLYFKGQAGNSVGHLGPGIDLRGDGGYVLAPGSKHRSGGTYELVSDAPIAEAPAWLLEAINRARPKAQPTLLRGQLVKPAPEVLEQVSQALDKHGPAIAFDGGNDHTFQAAALLLNDFGLSFEEAWPLFQEWNESCQPPWDEDDLETFLRNGAKYAKLPYGCRRVPDAVATVNALIAGWELSRDDSKTPHLVAQAAELVRLGVDPATRAVIQNRLANATGLKPKDLKLPAAVDPIAQAELRARRAEFESGAGDLIDTRDMLATAKRFLQGRANDEGLTDLRRWQGDTYINRGSHDEPISDEAVRALLYKFLEGKRDVDSGAPVKPDRALVENLQHALLADALLSAPLDPAWIEGPSEPDPAQLIAFDNGLLDLTTRELQPLTRRLFNRTARSFSYDAKAPQPAGWLQFLSQIWPDDAESIATLQEMTGLLLTGDTRHQKLFLLIGPKRSGKGTIARVLSTLIGERNVCAPTLNGLSSHFGLESLIAKTAAIISDARMGGRTDPAAVVENLLRISGEDSISIPRKHRTDYTAKLRTRFLLLTNEIPNFVDQSGALSSRFIVMRMTKSFYGQEDHGLTDALTHELPGILLWALAGLDRLRARGHFVQPTSALPTVTQMENLSSPIKSFVAECCTVNPGARVPIADLYQAWVEWTGAQGRDHAGTVQMFGRNLTAAFPEVNLIQPWIDQKRVRCYEGLRLVPAGG